VTSGPEILSVATRERASVLLEGRHVETPCPDCGVSTFPAVGHAWTLRCVDCGRSRHGAAVAVRPVPGANNGYRLGQGGSAGWWHTPRSVTGLEDVVRPPAAAPLVPATEVGAGFAGFRGRVPAGVVRRRYAAALVWAGEGSAENPRTGWDRWKLLEVMVCDGPHVIAGWSRTGRGGWKRDVLWHHTPNGWSYGEKPVP
jgi:hypothetical protein